MMAYYFPLSPGKCSNDQRNIASSKADEMARRKSIGSGGKERKKRKRFMDIPHGQFCRGRARKHGQAKGYNMVLKTGCSGNTENK